MFKIEWDKSTGGVLFSSKTTPSTINIAPRPVFKEELDMLGMQDKYGWTYPNTSNGISPVPLLWACNKQYFYKGTLVFEVKGGNLYDMADVIISDEYINLNLDPVDVESMLHKNSDCMFLLESEAVEFIRDIYVMYSSARKSVQNIPANQIDFEAIAAEQEKKTKTKMAIIKEDCDSFDIVPEDVAKGLGKRVYQSTKIDTFLASFSGGKDSQVLLDLCTRAMPPSSFEVIYSDTGYELPESLLLYNETQRYYNKLYPNLKFRTAKNHNSVISYWDQIGTPSDKHRWCCSVMKTAPLYRLLKLDGSKKILTFDGVRAEESVRRSGYSRIGKGVKHNNVINASPILNWTTSEVFMYLLKYNLPINPAYLQGMTRVGCLICPFSSEWNDMISAKTNPSEIKPFVDRIEVITKNSGVEDITNYIKAGNWKRRAGGRGIKSESFLHIEATRPHLKTICTNPKKDLLTWLSAACEYTCSHRENETFGEIRYRKKLFRYTITSHNNVHTAIFENTDKEPVLQGLLKRVLYKSTYCINCGACEVECPTGALQIIPNAIIDQKKCTHCQKCLNFHELGCIAANSLAVSENNQNKNKMKLISYNNFGLNADWLDMFMSMKEIYFVDNNHGLHPKEQLPNFVKWLVQADILVDAKTKELSKFGKIISELYIDIQDVIWELIWVNLAHNAPIAKWYVENVEWNFEFTEADIRELLKSDYTSDSPTTIRNIVYALFRTFRESPIGGMGLLASTGKLQYKKTPCEDISRETIAYSLYKYAESNNIRSFRVSDIFASDSTCGTYREFGLSKSDFEKHLRSLNSDANRVLVAELNMGLDHITLRDDLNSVSVLKILFNL